MAKTDRQKQIDTEFLSQEKQMVRILENSVKDSKGRQAIRDLINVHNVRRLYLDPAQGKIFTGTARDVLAGLDRMDKVDLQALEERLEILLKKVAVMETKLKERTSENRKLNLKLAAFENAAKEGVPKVEHADGGKQNQ